MSFAFFLFRCVLSHGFWFPLEATISNQCDSIAPAEAEGIREKCLRSFLNAERVRRIRAVDIDLEN